MGFLSLRDVCVGWSTGIPHGVCALGQHGITRLEEMSVITAINDEVNVVAAPILMLSDNDKLYSQW